VTWQDEKEQQLGLRDILILERVKELLWGAIVEERETRGRLDRGKVFTISPSLVLVL